uniref:BTB domain-containing protein n=1 Tax=Anisakis simplex TaxID=6269 RepID=A0A0M3KB41_ANISI
LREALSETETSSWSTGILHIGRALLEAARHNVALDIPLHSDFVGDEKANDKQQNGTVLNINNECDQGAVLLEGNKMVKLDCYEFAQISPYFRAAFFGNFEEARTKQIMFGDPESDKFLNCLEFVRHLISDDKENIDPSLTSMSIEKALELLDIASYLLIEPALQVLSDRIIGITPASKLVAVYHYAENRYHPLAKRLWDLIVREFDKLMAGDAYFE